MDAYMNIDNDLICHGTLTDEVVIQTIQLNQAEDNDHEVQSQGSENVVITQVQAANNLKELRQFFMAQSNETSTALSKIDDLEGALSSNTIFFQTSINQFNQITFQLFLVYNYLYLLINNNNNK